MNNAADLATLRNMIIADVMAALRNVDLNRIDLDDRNIRTEMDAYAEALRSDEGVFAAKEQLEEAINNFVKEAIEDAIASAEEALGLCPAPITLGGNPPYQMRSWTAKGFATSTTPGA